MSMIAQSGLPVCIDIARPDQKSRHFLDWFLSRGKADALKRVRRLARQALDAQSEMRAAAIIDDRVDFIDESMSEPCSAFAGRNRK